MRPWLLVPMLMQCIKARVCIRAHLLQGRGLDRPHVVAVQGQPLQRRQQPSLPQPGLPSRAGRYQRTQHLHSSRARLRPLTE